MLAQGYAATLLIQWMDVGSADADRRLFRAHRAGTTRAEARDALAGLAHPAAEGPSEAARPEPVRGVGAEPVPQPFPECRPSGRVALGNKVEKVSRGWRGALRSNLAPGATLRQLRQAPARRAATASGGQVADGAAAARCEQPDAGRWTRPRAHRRGTEVGGRTRYCCEGCAQRPADHVILVPADRTVVGEPPGFSVAAL